MSTAYIKMVDYFHLFHTRVSVLLAGSCLVGAICLILCAKKALSDQHTYHVDAVIEPAMDH